MMEEALISLLLADAGVAALVGDRVNFSRRDITSGTLPAIVLTAVGGSPDYTMAGESGLNEVRIQIECFAEKYGAAKKVHRAVRELLSGMRMTHQNIEFQGGFIGNERDSNVSENQARHLFLTSCDFNIWYCKKEQ